MVGESQILVWSHLGHVARNAVGILCASAGAGDGSLVGGMASGASPAVVGGVIPADPVVGVVAARTGQLRALDKTRATAEIYRLVTHVPWVVVVNVRRVS